MAVCNPITTCARSAIHVKRHIGTNLCGVVSRGSSDFCCYSFYSGHPERKYVCLGVSVPNTVSSSFDICFQTSCRSCFPSLLSKQRGKFRSLTANQSVSVLGFCKGQLDSSFVWPSVKMRFLAPKQGVVPNIKCSMGNQSWSSRFTYAGLICSILICYSSSEPVEAANDKERDKDERDRSSFKFYNGKRVYTDYTIIGIPGDGRCLFRSVAHGACLRSGRPAPSGSLQRELADELRAKVADEFVKRREETEWFVEGDFDTYVSQIRKPHVWGGEPELFMASHVLQMPITVYMHDEKAGGLISIAEYGQEYGKESPIRVIYHGFGHYDALQIHERKGAKSKL